MLIDTMTQPERLRLLRVAQRLSQDALAQRAGISAPYLCRIERGYARPSPAVLDRIARALGLPPVEYDADAPEAQP
jgi:transcriptional regulator with XRE-family HTH domain